MAITVRIDEFSAPGDIDGSLSTEEQTRFLTFGFDIPLDEPAVIVTPRGRINMVCKERRTFSIIGEKRVYTISKERRSRGIYDN